ncbi:MAG TPA: NADH:flavin oxidoreductase/NADH oxidase [Caulobacteraceae bacterium]|jgi:2,4-dienoyl-CoA reductase-like NADH-dependent reductase (Old Yellow Enzyme family)|nr:NADH:flavin oxidoreductase/NADH oxidase [Caulobacteraceae bacterium]
MSASSSPSPALLSPFTIGELTLKNRIVVSPMCQYSAIDGLVTDWHLVHLGRFALGGAGLVFVEATGVEARGRISPGDVGLWNDDQARALARIAGFLKANGAAAGIQLAHAGRKGSTRRPWDGGAELGAEDGAKGEPAWETLAPSAIAFADKYPMPKAMSTADMGEVIVAFREATRRAFDAGFDVVEIHAAHGYLLHEFLSPLSNHRTDDYGGDRAGRMKFPLEVIETVRAVWPTGKPLFLRVSSSDYVEGGLTIEDTVAFAKEAKALGVDVVDCSSGGNTPTAPRLYPGYQVSFAKSVREGAEIATMAVGLILDAHLARDIIADGKADLVALARPALEDPNFAIHASALLTGTPDYALAPTPAKSGLDRLAQALRHMEPI